MEANKNNQQKQEANNAKSVNGTEQSSSWEKAAETIAGDNQLMSTLLKLLLSPFTLIAGLGLIIYLFIKNKSHKDEIVKLKEENKKLTDEKLFLEQTSESFRKKYKKMKKVFEVEQEQAEHRALPQGNQNSPYINNVNKNKNSYLR